VTTEREEFDSLVPLCGNEPSLLERHPFILLGGAGVVGYLVGRYAGEEVLRTSLKIASGMISKRVEEYLRFLHEA